MLEIPSRILIIRLSAIGDCVMASPVPHALREAFPNSHLVWVVGEKSRAVVEGMPSLDEVLVWKRGLKGFLDIVRQVRRGRFDTVLELQGRPKSTVLMVLSSAKRRLVSPRFGAMARFFSTQLVDHPPGYIYPPLRYICWVKALGVKDPQLHLTVPLTDSDRAAAKRVLESVRGKFVALNPGCSASNRKWDVKKFAEAGKKLVDSRDDVTIVVCGGPQDKADAEVITAALPPGRVFNAAAKLNLRGTAALLERCDVVITNDTGPMHMAVAVGAPVVGVFGPVEAKRRLPLDAKNIGIEHNEECRSPNRPKCSKGGFCTCLQSITPQEVSDAALSILGK